MNKTAILFAILQAMATLASPIEPATAINPYLYPYNSTNTADIDLEDRGYPKDVTWKQFCPSCGYTKYMCCKHNSGHHHQDCVPGLDINGFDDYGLGKCPEGHYHYRYCCRPDKVKKFFHMTWDCRVPCNARIDGKFEYDPDHMCVLSEKEIKELREKFRPEDF